MTRQIIVCFVSCISLIHACIFYAAHEKIYLQHPTDIIEQHLVTDFNRGCELLCYYNPDKCLAANVIPNQNGSYLCQFVDGVIKTENRMFLTDNMGAKYISRMDGKLLQNILCYFN